MLMVVLSMLWNGAHGHENGSAEVFLFEVDLVNKNRIKFLHSGL